MSPMYQIMLKRQGGKNRTYEVFTPSSVAESLIDAFMDGNSVAQIFSVLNEEVKKDAYAEAAIAVLIDAGFDGNLVEVDDDADKSAILFYLDPRIRTRRAVIVSSLAQLGETTLVSKPDENQYGTYIFRMVPNPGSDPNLVLLRFQPDDKESYALSEIGSEFTPAPEKKKLQETLLIEDDFGVRDKVWFIYDGCPVEGIVEDILDFGSEYETYCVRLDDGTRTALGRRSVFASKKLAIEDYNKWHTDRPMKESRGNPILRAGDILLSLENRQSIKVTRVLGNDKVEVVGTDPGSTPQVTDSKVFERGIVNRSIIRTSVNESDDSFTADV